MAVRSARAGVMCSLLAASCLGGVIAAPAARSDQRYCAPSSAVLILGLVSTTPGPRKSTTPTAQIYASWGRHRRGHMVETESGGQFARL